MEYVEVLGEEDQEKSKKEGGEQLRKRHPIVKGGKNYSEGRKKVIHKKTHEKPFGEARGKFWAVPGKRGWNTHKKSGIPSRESVAVGVWNAELWEIPPDNKKEKGPLSGS